MIIKPPKLRKGETIGVVAPASPIQPERLASGCRYLEECGYKVKIGKQVHERYGYLAGGDKGRVDDLHEMFGDSNVHAIFCARGGYGTPRILEQVDYDLIKKNPKIFVGYSDITALQSAIFSKTNVVTFSGPMAAVEMGKGIEAFTESNFWPMLTGDQTETKFVGIDGSLKCLKPGKAEGRLLGGNLSLITALLGTPYLPDFQDAVLLLEEIGEEPYQIDRKLMQLKLAGILNQISGMVFGQFTDCASKKPEESLTLEQVINDITADLNIPIVTNFPYGHVDVKYTLPLGTTVYLNADEGFLQLSESPVI